LRGRRFSHSPKPFAKAIRQKTFFLSWPEPVFAAVEEGKMDSGEGVACEFL
jgi:hypothetical protein